MIKVLDGKYRIWRDGRDVRWAIEDWPDDGIGGQNHGSAGSLDDAIARCVIHSEARSEFDNT